MMYKKTTQLPNIVLDQYLRTLNASELKILLVIIRQTNGWIDTRTGKRKTRDRISHGQFKEKTGLCSKIISRAIQSLVLKGLITVTDQAGNVLNTTLERKGKLRLFYSFQPSYIIPPTMVQSSLGIVYKSVIDKTKYDKREMSSNRKIIDECFLSPHTRMGHQAERSKSQFNLI